MNVQTRSGLWTLLAATALLPIANGRWSFALAAWIAPAILVRYLRSQPTGRALAGGMLAMSVAEYFCGKASSRFRVRCMWRPPSRLQR
jgi:hypothetical protein